ncbi:MAG: ATP-binding protein [Deltaproteobacteria bacterium]|nr:ATP-binding protein [Deltaproteobacteria bacterium]
MIPRLLTEYLLRDASFYPVLAVTGPRQSGKTTLVKAAFPEHAYVSLEETDVRNFAKEDPRGFLSRFSGPAVIDEVQRTPDLLSYIQTEVDRDPSPGRYVLTGSQNLMLMEKVSQTLAGRCGILHLLAFSRAELEKQVQGEPASADKLFANRATSLDRWEIIRIGFYPPIHDRGIPPEVWLSDYVRTYVERDLRTLVNVGDLETFERFLKLCAGRIGQLVNYASLASDCGVAVDTARRWISVLKTSFIVFMLPPHYRNFNKRIIKSPKLYFHDTGLACLLLGIRNQDQLFAHPLRGALFENYIVAEVVKAYFNHRLPAPIFFWRDQSGHEIDLLIEDGNVLYPVEIKSAATVVRDMFEGLKWWTRLAGQESTPSALVYGGAESYQREGIVVRPWFSV